MLLGTSTTTKVIHTFEWIIKSWLLFLSRFILLFDLAKVPSQHTYFIWFCFSSIWILSVVEIRIRRIDYSVSCGWLFINIPAWEMSARRLVFGDVSFELAWGLFAPIAALQNRHSPTVPARRFPRFSSQISNDETTFFTFFHKSTIWKIPKYSPIKYKLGILSE